MPTIVTLQNDRGPTTHFVTVKVQVTIPRPSDEMFLAISRSQAIHVHRFDYSLSVCGRVRTDAVRAAGHEVLGELCPYCLTWLQRTSRTE